MKHSRRTYKGRNTGREWANIMRELGSIGQKEEMGQGGREI